MRHVKIICTIGPKTETPDMMRKMLAAGMNIARINLSHGESGWHEQIVTNLREASKDATFPLGIMVDTQGPEIRTSATEFGLETGDSFKIAINSVCDIQEGEKHTFIEHQDIVKNIKKGDTILIDDGLIALEVTSIEPHHLMCKVLNKGQLGKRKTVTLPGIKSNLPPFTDKDREGITKLAKHGIDFVAQSFVRRKQDIKEMRALLDDLGCKAGIIAKVEDQEAIDNIDEIIEECDAVMVARGDLGVEIPVERIPIVQHMIVRKCQRAGKPVIIATHLLESMVLNPRPTRAEVTDVANAAFQKVDAIMLSAETTKGEYPLECIRTMHKIVKHVQPKLKFESPKSMLKTSDMKEAITQAACINADALNARAILVFSRTGKFLSQVARKRPNTDLFVFTDDKAVRNQLMLHWATFSFHLDFTEGFHKSVDQAIAKLKEGNLVSKGDKIIIVSDLLPKKGVDTLEIRVIE